MNKNIFFHLAFLLAFLIPAHAQNMRIGIFQDDGFRIKRTVDGKFKLYDANSKTVLLTRADSIVRKRYLPFYIVKQGKKGVLGGMGQVLIPIEYNRIESLSPFFTLVEKGGRKGIYNHNGVKILDTIYSDIRNEGNSWSEEGRFHVCKDGKWGICNEKGRYLAEPIYDEIKGSGRYIELVRNDSSDYLIHYKQLITGVKMNDLSFTLYNRQTHEIRGFYIFQKDGKYGVLDENNTVYVPAHYDYLFCPGDQYQNINSVWLIAKKDNRSGIVDLNGNTILPFDYEEISTTFMYGYLVTKREDGKRFFNINTQTLITDYTFDSFSLQGDYITIKKDGKAALIDEETMKIVFPFKYQDINPNSVPGFFCVKKDGLYGLVDAQDREIIPPMYEEELFSCCGDKIVIRKDWKYGIINFKNQLLYGMIPYLILTHSNYFEIWDRANGYPKLDCDLKEIKDP